MKLEKFDLEKVVHGAKVVTRDGREVTQLSKFETDSDYCLYGVVNGIVEDWTIDGKYRLETPECSKDLYIQGKVQSIWVNVYKDANGYLWVGGDYFATFELAQNYATNQKYLMRPYLKTIEITDEV
jgi:hypothetical protein